MADTSVANRQFEPKTINRALNINASEADH